MNKNQDKQNENKGKTGTNTVSMNETVKELQERKKREPNLIFFKVPESIWPKFNESIIIFSKLHYIHL